MVLIRGRDTIPISELATSIPRGEHVYCRYADLTRQLEKHNPETAKLWESPGRAMGLPLIN
ncbi:MAG: hypothetical protein IMF11_06685 [Proteobacteria bacterium]|nr:hypothetical protein [Pseudomonadota bacterium]